MSGGGGGGGGVVEFSYFFIHEHLCYISNIYSGMTGSFKKNECCQEKCKPDSLK